MAKRGYIPTTQEIQSIYNSAIAGDPDAIKELGDLNNKLAKRANERMRDIERRDMGSTAAYQRAQYYLGEQGRDKFSQSRKLDPDAAYENIIQVNNYLRAQTSTAAGEMQRREKIVDSLIENNYIDISEDSELSNDEFKKRFLDFLSSDAWEDIRKHNKGGTNILVSEASEAIQNGVKIGDLTRAFKDYQRGADTDYIEMWENWTGGQKYYRGGSWHDLKRPRY